MEEELKLAPVIMERMGSMQMLSAMQKCFGGRRATELIGWAILFAVAGIENGPKLRRALEQAGYSESAFYRALADYRKFAEFLEREYKHKVSLEEVVRLISNRT